MKTEDPTSDMPSPESAPPPSAAFLQRPPEDPADPEFMAWRLELL